LQSPAWERKRKHRNLGNRYTVFEEAS